MSMDILLPALLLLALLDSLNPSALAVALWLLSRPQAGSRLVAYVGGILLAYLGLGIAMMLGFTVLGGALGDLLDHPALLAAQALLGAALLTYAILAPADAPQRHGEPRPPPSGRLAAYALLGMGVTVAELVTALPYFAAIALLLRAELPPAQWLPLLLGYNLIFVAPPLLLLALHTLLGRWTNARLQRWRERLQRGARETALWVFAIAGVALIGDAVSRWIAAARSAEGRDQASLAHRQPRSNLQPATVAGLLHPTPPHAGELHRSSLLRTSSGPRNS